MSILAAATEVCERHYGLRSVESLVPLPGRRHVFLVASASARYILKCMAASDTEAANLTFTHQLVALLSSARFSTYAVIPTTTGSTWVADAGMFWEMHSFIDGRVLPSLASSPAAVGSLLGRYHQAVASLVSSQLLPAGNWRACGWLSVDPTGPLRVLRSRAGAISASAFVDELANSVRSWISSLVGPSIAIPLHGDVSESNIIVTDSGLYLIDFESIVVGDPWIDVAQTVSRLISSGAIEQDACRDAVNAFLSAYSKSSKAACPISLQLDLLTKLHLLLDWACRLLSQQASDSAVVQSGSQLRRELALVDSCLG